MVHNGYATSFFELERGVRQGCPHCDVLIVTVVEILANLIRNDKLITGINFKGREYLNTRMTPHAWCATKSQLKKLEAFRGCGGLELSRSKTEALWLGKTRPQSTNLFNINGPMKCVCLGVSFS